MKIERNQPMELFRITLALILLNLGFQNIAFAQSDEIQLRKKHFWLNSDGLALDGYDPVTYFTGKPKKGSKTNRHIYKGIPYQFSSAKNKESFLQNPGMYEPDFGGWCSYAVGAKCTKVEPDPENFKIIKGRINLFYKDFFNNTLKTWNEDEVNLKKKADQNWTTKLYL